MSAAQVTEAHRALAREIMFNHTPGASACAQGIRGAAQLIADSEAKACDQLRAEVDAQCLLNGKGAEREADLLGRLERAEREVERLKSDGAASAFIAMSCRASRAEAELATERARLDWLMAGGVCMIQHTGGFHVSRLHAPVSRAAIDKAMKEGA